MLCYVVTILNEGIYMKFIFVLLNLPATIIGRHNNSSVVSIIDTSHMLVVNMSS